MLDPLRYAAHSVSEDDIAAVVRVLRSDWLTQGPELERFEVALAAYTGAKYAVACNSGTAALYLAYRAANTAAIVTSPLTFMATANAALMADMRVYFEDVDPATGNVVMQDREPGLAVPVHFAGRAAPIPTNCTVVEDAAQALGAMDFDGCSRVGSCAHSLAACFSLHASKPCPAGEGGAVTTNDEGFAREVRSLRDHGRRDGLMVSLSGNYRMPDILAALALSQLGRCDEMREKRRTLALIYHDHLRCDGVLQPEWSPDAAWHLYPIRIKGGKRDEVKAKLAAQGIFAQVHYSPIVPAHPYWREAFPNQEHTFPNAEAWAAEELSLPLHARMREADVRRVVDALRGAR